MANDVMSANPYALQSALSPMGGSNLGLAPSISGAMGNGTGGYFPTSAEFFNQRQQQVRNQELMMSAMRDDPRARAGTDFLVKSMFGADQARIQDFYKSIGGQGTAISTLSGLINMPGISGFLGGDVRSMMFGSMSLVGGGASINKIMSFGQGLVQEHMTRHVFANVMDNFFTKTGANRMAATSGLNMDQIGGIMTQGAVQGAFSGLDLGSIMRADGTGHLDTKLNPASMDKIKDFIKTASKSMAALIDVFGQQDISTLGALAQKITGLDMSSMRNVAAMSSRIGDIKATAGIMGIDTSTAFQGAMMGTAFGQQALGLSQYAAGGVSSSLTSGSLMMSRFMQQDPGFFMRRQSFDEIHQSRMMDVVGMSRDPRGQRAALLALDTQNGLTGTEGLQKMLAGMRPGEEGAFDREYRKVTGVSVVSAINAQGGPMALFEKISPDQQGMLGDVLLGQHSVRQRQLAGRIATRAMGRDGTGFAGLLGQFDDSTLGAMIDASGGSVADIAKIAMGDTGLGLSQDQANQAARTLKGVGAPIHAMRSAMLAVRSDPQTAGWVTDSIRGKQAQMALDKSTLQFDAEDERKISGFLQNGAQQFFQALGPDSPQAQIAGIQRFQRLNSGKARVIWGMNGDLSLDPDSYHTGPNGVMDADSIARFDATIGAMPQEVLDRMQITSYANRPPETIGLARGDAFRKFTGTMRNPEQAYTALRGYTRVNGAGGTQQLVLTAAMKEQAEFDAAGLTAQLLGGINAPAGSEQTLLKMVLNTGVDTSTGRIMRDKNVFAAIDRTVTSDRLMQLTSEQASAFGRGGGTYATHASSVLSATIDLMESRAVKLLEAGDEAGYDAMHKNVNAYKIRRNEIDQGMTGSATLQEGMSRIYGAIMINGKPIDINLKQVPIK